MLALAFLLLIGVALVADALHFHVPRGYLYFAIAFSLMVETLNLVATRRRKRAAEQEGAESLSFRSPLPATPLSPLGLSPGAIGLRDRTRTSLTTSHSCPPR